MNRRMAIGMAGVAVVAVGVGIVAGLALVGGPADAADERTTPTATPTGTPEPPATPILTTISATTTPAPTPTPTPAGPVSPAAVEYQIYQRVNFHRTSNGYDRLRLNESMREVARTHSEEMAAEGSLALEGSGDRALSARLERFGVDCVSSTETVARVPFDTPVEAADGTTVRYDTAKAVARGIVRQWMRGEGSRSEVLRFEWTEVAVGVHVGETPEGPMVYATQDLCET
jgi:uncharacterized protein YkwD